MLALIRTLGPVVALVIGLAGGGTIIGAGAYLYNIVIDNPRVAKEAHDAAIAEMTIKLQRAVEAARAAAIAQQQAVMRDALAAYQALLAAHDQEAADKQDQLEQEISDHEKQDAADGRSCPLDDADLDWLRKQ